MVYLFIYYCSYSLEPVGYGRYRRKYLSKHQQKQQNRCESRRANQTKEILHRAAACPNPSVLSYTKIKS